MFEFKSYLRTKSPQFVVLLPEIIELIWSINSKYILKLVISRAEHAQIILQWILECKLAFLKLKFLARNLEKSSLVCEFGTWMTVFLLKMQNYSELSEETEKVLWAWKKNEISFSLLELRTKEKKICLKSPKNDIF